MPPAPAWGVRWGSVTADKGQAVAVQSTGNVVVLGSFTGSVDVGCGPVSTSSTSGSLLLFALSPSGACVWSRGFTGTGSEPGGVAVDAEDNIVVAGTFSGMLDLGCGTLTSAGGQDALLARLDPTGACLWSRAFGDVAAQQGVAVKTGATGDVVFLGTFAGAVNLGLGPLTSAGSTDVFLACFSPDGTAMWTERFGDSQAQTAAALAVSPTGDVVIAGAFSGTLNLGGGVLVSAGGVDVFLGRFDAQGTALWSKRLGGTGEERGLAVAVDAAGNTLLGGTFTSTVDLGGGPLTNAGGVDGFVGKFSPQGAHLWSRDLGAASDQAVTALASDGLGNVVLAGNVTGSVDLGGGPLTSAGGTDVLVAAYSGDGAHLWSRVLGDAQPQAAQGVAVAQDNSVLLTGSLQGALDDGTGVLTSAGGQDGIVLHLVP